VVLRPPFSTSTVMVRKHRFEEVGLFETGLRNAEDRDMYIRVGGRFPIAKLGAVLVWAGRDCARLSNGSEASEQTTRQMILGVFERVACLRGRFLLKRQALSQAAFEASKMYQAHGDHLRALDRILRSLALWPLPYRRDNATPPFARMRTLIVTLLRTLHLKPT
jgi:hypothetical protein